MGKTARDEHTDETGKCLRENMRKEKDGGTSGVRAVTGQGI